MTVRRPPSRVGGARSFVGLVGLVVLAGCSGAPEDADVVSAPSTAPPSTSASAAPTTSAPPVRELPSGCSDLLSLRQIDTALGTSLPGQTVYTVGTPEPGIGRTGRITCGFGVVPATADVGASDPLLELSVFAYTDERAAADRVDSTVDAQQARGVRFDEAVVPGASAVLLTGPEEATLIATVGARTYSLSLVPGILDAASTQPALQSLMGDVLAADTPPAAGGTSTGRGTASPTG